MEILNIQKDYLFEISTTQSDVKAGYDIINSMLEMYNFARKLKVNLTSR